MTIQAFEQTNFRYTFGKATLTNTSLTEGLYEVTFRKNQLIIAVDKFGEARLSNETPINNTRKLALAIRKILL